MTVIRELGKLFRGLRFSIFKTLESPPNELNSISTNYDMQKNAKNNVTLHLYLSHPHQVTTGTTSLTPRWDKCVNYVENSLVYAAGRLFVNTHFQEGKKHMVRGFLCSSWHHVLNPGSGVSFLGLFSCVIDVCVWDDVRHLKARQCGCLCGKALSALFLCKHKFVNFVNFVNPLPAPN